MIKKSIRLFYAKEPQVKTIRLFYFTTRFSCHFCHAAQFREANKSWFDIGFAAFD